MMKVAGSSETSVHIPDSTASHPRRHQSSTWRPNLRIWLKYIQLVLQWSWDRSVGMGNGLDKQAVGVRLPAGVRHFLFSPRRPDRLWDPFRLPVNGYRSPLPGIKATGTWSRPSSSSVKGKNARSYNSVPPPPYVFMMSGFLSIGTTSVPGHSIDRTRDLFYKPVLDDGKRRDTCQLSECPCSFLHGNESSVPRVISAFSCNAV